MNLLTLPRAQQLLTPYYPLLWEVVTDAVGRFDKFVANNPDDAHLLGNGTASHMINDYMRGAARRVFATVEGVAVQDLPDGLLVVAIDQLDGSVVIRFNKNGEDPHRRRNDTLRWDEFESHSLDGFPQSTHLVVGYDLAPVDRAITRVTVTCPVPSGNHWSYNINDSQDGVGPVDTQQPLGGMPPVAPATLTSKKAGKRKTDREAK